MIIKSSYETINRLIEFLYYNSGYVNLYFNSFDYNHNFGDILLDLLANCNKIKNVDYSKFIVYIMLSKFCPIKEAPMTVIMFPNTLEPNHLRNLSTSFMYYKKCIIIMDMETENLEIRSCHYVTVENNLIASTCLNIIEEQEYEYSPQIAFVNSFAYYLCLLF